MSVQKVVNKIFLNLNFRRKSENDCVEFIFTLHPTCCYDLDVIYLMSFFLTFYILFPAQISLDLYLNAFMSFNGKYFIDEGNFQNMNLILFGVQTLQ